MIDQIIQEADRRVELAESKQAELARQMNLQRSSFELEIQQIDLSRLSLLKEIDVLERELKARSKLSEKAAKYDSVRSQLDASLKEAKVLRGERNRLTVDLEGARSRLSKTGDKKWGGAAVARRKQSQLEAEIARQREIIAQLEAGLISTSHQDNPDEKDLGLTEAENNPVYHSGVYSVLFSGSSADQERALPLLSRVQALLGESSKVTLDDPQDPP